MKPLFGIRYIKSNCKRRLALLAIAPLLLTFRLCHALLRWAWIVVIGLLAAIYTAVVDMNMHKFWNTPDERKL